MKKILVGLIVVSLLFGFQIVTVHGNSFTYKEKLAGMISSVENFFIDQKDAFSNLFWDKQDDRNKKIEGDLALIYEEVSGVTTNDVNQYKRNYLLNLAEREEGTQLHEPFTEYTKQKNIKIESEIRDDIAEYISELIEQDEN